jgi:hypothetical protein
MKHYTTKYNKKLLTIQHYEKYPQMLPWIGADYDNWNHKKVLVIGESHFLPPKSKIHKSPTKWYNGNISNLNDDEDIEKNERAWTNTVGCIKDARNQIYDSKSQWIYKNIELALIKTRFTFNITEHMFRYIAYYNYFQRPANNKGESINHTAEDTEIAALVFMDLIKIIKPEIVCFTSDLAWKACLKSNSLVMDEANWVAHNNENTIVADVFPHPTCAWWNRKAYYLHGRGKKLTGQSKFINFLKYYEAFGDK